MKDDNVDGMSALYTLWSVVKMAWGVVLLQSGVGMVFGVWPIMENMGLLG